MCQKDLKGEDNVFPPTGDTPGKRRRGLRRWMSPTERGAQGSQTGVLRTLTGAAEPGCRGGAHTPFSSLAPQSPIPASPVGACSPDWEPSPPWTLVSISGVHFSLACSVPSHVCCFTCPHVYPPPRLVFMLVQVPAPCKRPAPTCSCPHGQREGLAQAGLHLNPKPPEEPGCRTAGPDLWVALTSPGKKPASRRRKLPQG